MICHTVYLKKDFQKIKKKDRFENLNNKFFNDVYDGYVSIANNNKKRIKRVDANCSKEDVFSQITSIIDTKFKHDLIL